MRELLQIGRSLQLTEMSKECKRDGSTVLDSCA